MINFVFGLIVGIVLTCLFFYYIFYVQEGEE